MRRLAATASRSPATQESGYFVTWRGHHMAREPVATLH